MSDEQTKQNYCGPLKVRVQEKLQSHFQLHYCNVGLPQFPLYYSLNLKPRYLNHTFYRC